MYDRVLTLCEHAGEDLLRLVWKTDTIEYTWADTKTEQEYTTQLDGNRYEISGSPHCFFLKQCQIKMYAVVKLSSGVGMYDLISGEVEANTAYSIGRFLTVDPTELDFRYSTGRECSRLNVWADGFRFIVFDIIASDEYWDASRETGLAMESAGLARSVGPGNMSVAVQIKRGLQRLAMESALAQRAATAGRGWNSTRRDVLEQFVAQLH